MRCHVLLLSVCFLLTACTASARTWIIQPDSTGDAPTIQAGIDSASAGDTVMVACGTYRECDISIKSGIYLTSETGTADCVTIDAEWLGGRVFYCFGVDSTTTVVGFTAAEGSADGWGGGLYCYGSHPRFTNCTLWSNYAEVGAGGAYLKLSSPVFAGCVFSENYHVNAGAPAGGIYAIGGSPKFTDCVFSDNGTGLCTCGGVFCDDSCTATFENCLFARNVGGMGGALSLLSDSYAELTNCTFSENFDYTDRGGGVECDVRSSALLNNCIVAFSLSGQGVWWDGTGEEPVLVCCDLYGNADGDWVGPIADQYGINGNISEDPLFCDPESDDYHLDEDSPCAPAQQPVCGLIGAFGAGCYSGIPRGRDPSLPKQLLLSVKPNPFRDAPGILYEIPGGPGTYRLVLLQVYDAAGRHIRTLVEGPQPAGRHVAAWDGLDAEGRALTPGVYFCRMQAGDTVLTCKIVVVR